jgi:penicillin-binding protein 1B
VYLAALESKRYTLTSRLDDTPVDIKVPGGRWQPKNYDKQFHGAVPLHRALSESYNAATAHLGLELGVPKVLATIQRLGVERELPVVPSVFLGAGELSPLEVAVMYQTLAAQGVSAGLRSIRTITDAEGIPLARFPQKPIQAVSPAAIHVLHYAMQEVMQEGTGRASRSVLPNLRVAGKTGTTDDLRDSWFAGFSGDYMAVVWMGRDDNKPTRLTGATGALKGWMSFMAETSHVPLNFEAPAGISYAWVDDATGLLSAENCDGARYIPFMEGTEPTAQGPSCSPLDAAQSWFKSLF